MISKEEKYELLQCIADCVPENGAAEDEENLLQNFLPLRSYSKLANPKVFLITGGRGTGKTELFHILTSCDGLRHVLSEGDKKRITDLQESRFIVGYSSESKKLPAQLACSRWIKGKTGEEIEVFWIGLACAVILQEFAEDEQISTLAKSYIGEELKDLFQCSSSDPSKWWPLADEKIADVEQFLNSLDDLLSERRLQIFLNYDELDRICGNYRELFDYIRQLLNFWFVHNNRFSNIKAKIFLRSDLYNAKSLQFVDSSKMRAYHLELKWDVLSLYRMLVKRMANCGYAQMVCYLREASDVLLKEKNEELGYLPGDSEEAFQLLVEKMIGRYMGKNAKRGRSYAWVPNHIQDANGELAPRSFLKCFSFAAASMIQQMDELERLEGDRLLSPVVLQGALAHVSADRVDELVKEEYKWLSNLIVRLKDKTLLIDKQEFKCYLEPDCWPEEERESLPGRTSEQILEVLISLGIVMVTADSRINVPEIYLHGFGLKRRGGIKRPKQK